MPGFSVGLTVIVDDLSKIYPVVGSHFLPSITTGQESLFGELLSHIESLLSIMKSDYANYFDFASLYKISNQFSFTTHISSYLAPYFPTI